MFVGMNMDVKRNLYETIVSEEDSKQNPGRDRTATIRRPARVVALGDVLKRSNSMGDCQRKRKARDNMPGTDGNILKKKEDPITFILIEALAEMAKHIKDLGKKTEESANTKREIKEIALKLGRQAEVVCRMSVKQWLEDHRWVKVDVPVYEAETQTDTKGRDIAIQVNQEGREKMISSLEGIDTLEKYKAIEDKRWEREIFKITEIKEGGGLLSTKDSVVKVIWVDPEDVSMEKGVNKKFKDRYPILVESKTDFEVIEQTIRMKSENSSTREKIIKVTAKMNDQALWEYLTRIRCETTEEEWVAFSQIDGVSLRNMRRMAECIFQSGNTKIVLYPAKGKPQAKIAERQQKIRERKTYALVVEEAGKDYREVLGKVKAAARNSTASSAIRGLRSTRDGKRLVIITDKDEEAVGRLQRAIGESEGLNIKKKTTATQTEVVHIRGIDAFTSKEEAMLAVEEIVGKSIGICRLSELRPLANNTLAVTLTIDRDAAAALVSRKVLRIGMVSCLVEKRLKIDRCTRCWSHAHPTSECHGPDRTKLCFKCGGEGHTAKNCRAEEACPLCGVEGHSANRGRCKFFKRALSMARNEAKGRLDRLKTVENPSGDGQGLSHHSSH